jgi:AcrR family transcriptional regulator
MRNMTAQPTAASTPNSATSATSATGHPAEHASPDTASSTARNGSGRSESGRSRYHHGDLANALTQAAVGLAREGGPDAVVLREAARQVGVSPTAAYRHFTAHDDLLYSVKLQAQQALARAMNDSVGGSPASGDPAAEAVRRMGAIGLGYMRFALAEPGLFRTAFCHAEPSEPSRPSGRSAPDGPSDAEPHSVESLQRYQSFKILSDTLDVLVEFGVLPPERRPNAEIPAWSIVHGLAMLLLDGPLGINSAEEREAVMKLTVDTIINGLIR